MKTVTITITCQVDPTDFVDDKTKAPMDDEAILSVISDEVHDDLPAALQDLDYAVTSVTIKSYGE